MIVHSAINVGYLPKPNRVEIVLTSELADSALTRTSFVVPVFDNGDVLLADNCRRGIEIAGGHREGDETTEAGARRECLEETGAELFEIVPIGFMRMISEGQVPKDWEYPHPLSYQQFYAGRIKCLHPYEANDECNAPVRIVSLGNKFRRVSVHIFAQEARRVIGGFDG